MPSINIDRWRLVVPVKDQLAAKTRLHPPAGVARGDLAHAFALDTIAAVVARVTPRHLVVVTSDARTATFVRDQGGAVVPDPGGGLNAALRHGVAYAERTLGPGPTAVLLGDIPTLSAKDLYAALMSCSRHARAFVPDASGIGTVLLSALPPHLVDPRFGVSSAHEHERDCVRLNLDLPALRTDVDDDDALRSAMAIGVGRHTAAVMGQRRD